LLGKLISLAAAWGGEGAAEAFLRLFRQL